MVNKDYHKPRDQFGLHSMSLSTLMRRAREQSAMPYSHTWLINSWRRYVIL